MPLIESFVDINIVIDDRNRSLWETLLHQYDITVEPSWDDEHRCLVQNNQVAIYLPEENINIEAFTHELLHVLLHSKQQFIGAIIINLVRSNTKLSAPFDDELLHHISNDLEHVKMLPIFQQMGFDGNKFLKDFQDHACPANILASIQKYSKKQTAIRLSLYEAISAY